LSTSRSTPFFKPDTRSLGPLAFRSFLSEHMRVLAPAYVVSSPAPRARPLFPLVRPPVQRGYGSQATFGGGIAALVLRYLPFNFRDERHSTSPSGGGGESQQQCFSAPLRRSSPEQLVRRDAAPSPLHTPSSGPMRLPGVEFLNLQGGQRRSQATAQDRALSCSCPRVRGKQLCPACVLTVPACERGRASGPSFTSCLLAHFCSPCPELLNLHAGTDVFPEILLTSPRPSVPRGASMFFVFAGVCCRLLGANCGDSSAQTRVAFFIRTASCSC
jgi:hypothetical protein